MIQKTTWMRYLIIGINCCFAFIFIGCGETITEYRVDVDIIYKNKTTHTIRYFQYDTDGFQQFIFELQPNSEKKIEIRGGGPDTDITNCCQGILEGFQGNSGVLINYDDGDKCLIYQSDQGSTTGNISAYRSREIERRYYEFIYTFTEEEYNRAENCN